MVTCFCEHGTNSPQCCVNRLKELTQDFPLVGKPKRTKDFGAVKKWLVPEEDSDV